MTRQEAFTMLDQMAKGIAEMFGSNCETVIHDLADPLHPVLAIYNPAFWEDFTALQEEAL